MSTSSTKTLQPTLWRTCRVLANRVRLRILHDLLDHPHQPVSVIARRTQVPPTVATQYLRALNARGLLEARRQGKWVYYRPAADKSVAGASALLKALQQTFDTQKEPIEMIFHHVTGFTHPRRLQIVQAIQADALSLEELRVRIAISRSALRRHLRKLVDRGYVVADEGRYRCIRPKGQLAKVLLQLALGD